MSASTPADTVPRSLLPAISVAIVILVLGLTVVTVLLAVADRFALSPGQVSTLIVASYGLPSVASLVLTAIYRQPILYAWSIPGVVFIASFAGVYSYEELLGATLAAGAVVLLIGVLRLSTWLSRAVPGSIVLGVLAALVMPFVVNVFTYLHESPVLIGGVITAYLVSRRLLPTQVPSVPPALVTGLLLAGVTGDLHRIEGEWGLPTMVASRPGFDWRAILTITPVLVALMAGMSNLGAIVYLKSQRYDVPTRSIDMVSGAGTMVSAFLAPVPINLALFVTPLTAGPEAGPHHLRHWSVHLTSVGVLLLLFGAGFARALPAAVPAALLFTMAGLALIPVLMNALTGMVTGPLRLGPLFAFVVASSDLSLGGVGAPFWGLVFGMGVTALLEGEEWRELRTS